MKLYFNDIFIEEFFYYKEYDIIYCLENSKMGYVFIPFIDKMKIKVSILEDNCTITIPEDAQVIKIQHITDFCFEFNIPYVESISALSYFYLFSLIYSSYIEYGEYIEPYFINMVNTGIFILNNDDILPGTLFELEKNDKKYNIKIVNAMG